MIAVPYHLGERGLGVGKGPLRIAESLALPCDVVSLSTADLPVRSRPPGRQADGDVGCGPGGPPYALLNRRLAEAVARETRPLILAGSCNCALGALAGLEIGGVQRPGIVWFDAHGDFNTPQTSISGSPDGMALAAAVGDCLPDVCAACGLSRSIVPENVILAAARDLDPDEALRLNSSEVYAVGIEDLTPALESMAPGIDAVYLHIDIDVLDPALSPGVNCTTPGGLTPDQLLAAIREVFRHVPVAAATLANYSPDRDADNRTLKIACAVAETLYQAMHV